MTTSFNCFHLIRREQYNLKLNIIFFIFEYTDLIFEKVGFAQSSKRMEPNPFKTIIINNCLSSPSVLFPLLLRRHVYSMYDIVLQNHFLILMY